jgi:hypothetical protein
MLSVSFQKLNTLNCNVRTTVGEKKKKREREREKLKRLQLQSAVRRKPEH